MKRFFKIRSDSGFTLIEMLVAIAVSGFILAGLTKILWTTNMFYTQQDETASLQQNLRGAKMVLEKDIRMAGSGFGNEFYPPTDVGIYNGGNRLLPIEINNPAKMIIRYMDSENPCNGALPPLKPTITSGTTPTTITFTPPSEPYTTSWTGGVAPCNPNPSSQYFYAIYNYSTDSSPPVFKSYLFRAKVQGTNILQCMGLTFGLDTRKNPVITYFKESQLVTIIYGTIGTELIRKVVYGELTNQDPVLSSSDVIAENINSITFAVAGQQVTVSILGSVSSALTSREQPLQFKVTARNQNI